MKNITVCFSVTRTTLKALAYYESYMKEQCGEIELIQKGIENGNVSYELSSDDPLSIFKAGFITAIYDDEINKHIYSEHRCSN